MQILSSLRTFEQFEKLKQQPEVFRSLARKILYQHQLSDAPLINFTESTNIVFGYGNNLVIKIYPPFHSEQFKAELLVLKHIEGRLPVRTPKVEHEGTIDGWPYIIMTKLEGTLLEAIWEKLDHSNKIIIIRELGTLIQNMHSLPTNGLESIDCHWDQFIKYQIEHCVEHHRAVKLPESLLGQLQRYLEPLASSLMEIKKPVLLTGEYTPMNFLVKNIGGIWHIDGLIDFGDCMLGLPEYDLLGPGAFLIQGDKQLLREFLVSYGYTLDELTAKLRHKLTALMLLHKYSNLSIQIRIKNWEHKVHTIQDLENLVWGLE